MVLSKSLKKKRIQKVSGITRVTGTRVRERWDLQTASENREDLEEQNIQTQKEKERKIAKVTPDRERATSVSVKTEPARRHFTRFSFWPPHWPSYRRDAAWPVNRGEEDDRGVKQMHDAIQSDDRCPDIAGRWNWVAAQSQIFPADLSVIRRGRSRRARAVTSDRVQVRCQRDRGRASRSNDGPADSPRANRPFKFMGLSRRLRLDQLIWLVYSLLCREVLESTFHSRVLGVLTHFISKNYLLSFMERGSLHSRFFVDESLSFLALKIISP